MLSSHLGPEGEDLRLSGDDQAEPRTTQPIFNVLETPPSHSKGRPSAPRQALMTGQEGEGPPPKGRERGGGGPDHPLPPEPGTKH